MDGDKITKFRLMTASINAILDSTGCGHPFFDQDINDYDMQDMFDDSNNDSDDSNDSQLNTILTERSRNVRTL